MTTMYIKMIKALSLLLAVSAISCTKNETALTKSEHLHAELIAELTSVEPGKPFWAALKLEMEDGWHVNWLNPGDAGLAPTINWDLPPGFTAGEINWPIPKRIPVGDLMLFGYDGTLLLPVEITPPSEFKDEELTLSAACDWVVCGDVCIPGEAKFTLTLPVTGMHPAKNNAHAAEFASTRNNSPVTDDLWKMVAFVSDNTITITVVPVSEKGPKIVIESLMFFPNVQGIINNAAEQRFSRGEFAYQLEIDRDKIFTAIPDNLEGIIVFKSKEIPATKGVLIDLPLSRPVSFKN